MKELEIAIHKLEKLKLSQSVGSGGQTEIVDVLSLLNSVADWVCWDSKTLEQIQGVLLEFDQNPVTSDFNKFLKWRKRK